MKYIITKSNEQIVREIMNFPQYGNDYAYALKVVNWIEEFTTDIGDEVVEYDPIGWACSYLDYLDSIDEDEDEEGDR